MAQSALNTPVTEFQAPNQGALKKVLILDCVERLAILVLYAYFLVNTLGSFLATHNVGNLLMLVTESILVGFVLCRKPAQNVSNRTSDWLLAFGATSLPLLVRSADTGEHLWNGLAVNLIFFGLVIQVLSKLTLGRRFGIVAANRGICMSGPYRVVRHPIYMGYLFSHVGFLLLNPTWWNLGIYVAVYTLKIPRILAEERLLNGDEEYQKYRHIVRYRLLPGVF